MNTTDLESQLRQVGGIAAAVVGGVALVGFLAGTSRSDYTLDTPLTPLPAGGHDVAPALSYTELRDHPRGAHASGFEEELASMRGPSPLDPVDVGRDRGPALEQRARLRAYDGAPPRIPHPVRQDSAAECLVCHDEGLRFRGRLAPPMSHRELTSCTQCHVVDEAPMPGVGALPPDPRAVPNSFAGLASPDGGPRFQPIGPPQIPHRSVMRERCASCHGVNGRNPMRSTHPARQSCEQCHTPSAVLDQRPGAWQ